MVRLISHLRIARLTFTVAAVFGAAAACGTKDAPDPLQPTGPTGRIRFVNLITDPSRNPVNAILENVPFGVNIAYTQSTPATLPSPATANFSPIYEGSRTLVVKKTADTSVTVATLQLTIAAGSDHTVFATGGSGASAVTAFTVAYPMDTAAITQARIRVVNMSPAAGAVDVFMTAANADLAAATPVATNLGVRAPGAVVQLPAGSYTVRTVPAGTAPAARAAAVSSTVAVTVAANVKRTVVLADAPTGGGPVRSFALTDQ
jgi:uncharacterized protein DUF4397